MEERAGFHGGNEVRKALGLGDKDFHGKEVLLVGELPQWGIGEELRKQGAKVVTKDVEAVAGRPKGFTSESPELQDPYDSIVFGMALAFYKKSDRKALLRKAIEKARFGNGGEVSTVSLDWDNFDRFAQESGQYIHADLLSISKRLFALAGNDRRYGKKQHREVQSAVRKSGKKRQLQTIETEVERPLGKSHWEEVRDLCDLLEGVVDSAEKQISASAPKVLRFLIFSALGLHRLRNDIRAYRLEVEGILALSEEQRPASLPPLFSIVTVKAKAATPR